MKGRAWRSVVRRRSPLRLALASDALVAPFHARLGWFTGDGRPGAALRRLSAASAGVSEAHAVLMHNLVSLYALPPLTAIVRWCQCASSFMWHASAQEAALFCRSALRQQVRSVWNVSKSRMR